MRGSGASRRRTRPRPAAPLTRNGNYWRAASRADRSMEIFHGTTILSVRRDGEVALGGDGQVTLGNVVIKATARKVRRIHNDRVLAGFAGATADAFTLFERFEAKLDKHQGHLTRAAVELAKDWRSDRILRRLEAMLAVADRTASLVITGTGDVLEPEFGIVAIGSGGPYAQAAARALLENTDIVRRRRSSSGRSPSPATFASTRTRTTSSKTLAREMSTTERRIRRRHCRRRAGRALASPAPWRTRGLARRAGRPRAAGAAPTLGLPTTTGTRGSMRSARAARRSCAPWARGRRCPPSASAPSRRCASRATTAPSLDFRPTSWASARSPGSSRSGPCARRCVQAGRATGVAVHRAARTRLDRLHGGTRATLRFDDGGGLCRRGSSSAPTALRSWVRASAGIVAVPQAVRPDRGRRQFRLRARASRAGAPVVPRRRRRCWRGCRCPGRRDVDRLVGAGCAGGRAQRARAATRWRARVAAAGGHALGAFTCITPAASVSAAVPAAAGGRRASAGARRRRRARRASAGGPGREPGIRRRRGAGRDPARARSRRRRRRAACCSSAMRVAAPDPCCAMQTVTDALARLFGRPHAAGRAPLRNLGMSAVDRTALRSSGCWRNPRCVKLSKLAFPWRTP